MKEKLLSYKWLTSVLLLCIIALLMFVFPTSGIEFIFRQHIYPLVRWGQNFVFGFLPFPGFVILILLLVFFILINFFNAIKFSQWKSFLHFLFQTAVNLVILFFIAWGLHYATPSTTLQVDTSNTVIQTFDIQKTIEQAITERNKAFPNHDSIAPEWPDIITNKMNQDADQWVQSAILELDLFPGEGAVKLRHWPSGMLLKWGISGIYIPFTGEPTIDRGLHALRMPHTALHEQAHSHGFTGEGDCNLIAYRAAILSKEPFIAYSAILERLKDEMYLLARSNYNEYQLLKAAVPEVIKSDLLSVRKYHSRYRGKLNNVGEWMNDHYLKSLGIEDGIEDYNVWVLKLKKLESVK